jgi:hypothetical protein
MFTSSEHGSELLRSVLRYLSWTMLCMGIFTLLSGGVSVVSSSLVIAMGIQWLTAVASPGSLVTHLEALSLLREKDCRGCCRNCCSGMCRGTFDNIRGLAIAAITFGVFELLTYVISFSFLGLGLAFTSSITDYYKVSTNRELSCYAGSSKYCTIYYNPRFLGGSSGYYSFNCYTFSSSGYCYATLPDTLYPTNDNSIGSWLFYAVGHTAVAAPLNIAWGALTLKLIDALTIMANESAGESTALLPKAAVPVFRVGKEKTDSSA